MVLVRQREHGLGEEFERRLAGLFAIGERVDLERELAHAGAHESAAYADVVAEIEQLVEREQGF